MKWTISEETTTIGLLILVLVLGLYPHFQNRQTASSKKENGKLYLKEQASVYVRDIDAFDKKVRRLSHQLGIAPSWFMAVMHSESRFDGTAINKKGSGASGLIQLMPETAEILGITTVQLRNLSPVEQLDFAYAYLDMVREQRNVQYKSLTDLYLAILYPKAIGKKRFVLYEHPDPIFIRNKGLDTNQDNKVTTDDIDRRMHSIYPTAYFDNPPKAGFAGFADSFPWEAVFLVIVWSGLFININQRAKKTPDSPFLFKA